MEEKLISAVTVNWFIFWLNPGHGQRHCRGSTEGETLHVGVSPLIFQLPYVVTQGGLRTHRTLFASLDDLTKFIF